MSAVIKKEDLYSSPDVPLTDEDLERLSSAKQLITTQDVYGVTASALMEPETLRDEGAPEPHPITGRKFSLTQVDLPFDIATEVRQLGIELIPEDDIYEAEGREENPHITVKYGIHSNFSDDVEKALIGVAPVKATIGNVMFFESDEYDVVNLDVISPDLKKLNKLVAESTEVTDTFPTYKPHICLAYVKKGRGKKYEGIETVLSGQEIEFDKVTFLSRNGDVTVIPLSEIVHEDKGGLGSGFLGHAGRPGLIGGSSSSPSGGAATGMAADWVEGRKWEQTDSNGQKNRYSQIRGFSGFKETVSGPYPDEYTDLRGYTNMGYLKLNAGLRAETLSGAPQLDNLISRNTINQDATIYRAIENGLGGFKVGDTFQDKAYVSTTWNKVVSDRLAPKDSNKLLIEISIRSGQQAFEVDQFEGGVDDIHTISEGEYLLPRGLTFRVDEVDTAGRPTKLTVIK